MSAPTTTASDSPTGASLRSRLEHDAAHTTAQVAEAVARATAALLDGDRELSAVVATRQCVIDLDCRALEDAVLAGARDQDDFLILVAASRIAAELAAAGALARDIATAVPRLQGSSLPPRVRGLLGRLGDETRLLLLAALRAGSGADLDPTACEPRTAVVDDLHRRLLAELFAGVVPLSLAVELTLIGRHYERLATHALAVAAEVRTVSRNGR